MGTEEILQKLLEILIEFMVPVILGLIGAGLVMLYRWIRTKVKSDTLKLIISIIDRLVLAAEQYGLTGQLLQLGAEKKAWVINEAQKELDSRNIKINVETLANLIEAAVREYDFPHADDYLLEDEDDDLTLPSPDAGGTPA